MRLLAISDIHGMYDKFMELLELIKYNPAEDKLLLLGDYVDRGPEPTKTIQKVVELVEGGAIALMGNHESMLLNAYLELTKLGYAYELNAHLQNGGSITWKAINEVSKEARGSIIQFIHDMPTIYEVDDYIFVHAGINPYARILEQDRQTLIWSREEFIDAQPSEWIQEWQNKTVIFGHTPTRYMGQHDNTIWHGNGKIGIDCGAVFGGKLACLELPSMNEYYV